MKRPMKSLNQATFTRAVLTAVVPAVMALALGAPATAQSLGERGKKPPPPPENPPLVDHTIQDGMPPLPHTIQDEVERPPREDDEAPRGPVLGRKPDPKDPPLSVGGDPRPPLEWPGPIGGFAVTHLGPQSEVEPGAPPVPRLLFLPGLFGMQLPAGFVAPSP